MVLPLELNQSGTIQFLSYTQRLIDLLRGLTGGSNWELFHNSLSSASSQVIAAQTLLFIIAYLAEKQNMQIPFWLERATQHGTVSPLYEEGM